MARVPNHPAIVRSYQRSPEWRMNPATGEWVILAPERSARPMMPEVLEEPPRPRVPCPFCVGREWNTPPELLAIRDADSVPNGPGWRVRCVPNSYPAVRAIDAPEPAGESFFRRAHGIGRHELFIECPQHETNLARLPVENIREVVHVWRDRVRAAHGNPSMHYAQLFKNHGGDAGASVEHAHSQLIVTPMIPLQIREELRFAADHHQEHGECVYCELLRREAADGSRTVAESSAFACFAAYAGRQPFETWIVPRTHHSQFELISNADADDLGTMIWTILRKLDRALGEPAYNLVFHTAPFHEPPLPYFHWHLEVLPRLTQLAGYEWGAGSCINPILPEDAAVVLRETTP